MLFNPPRRVKGAFFCSVLYLCFNAAPAISAECISSGATLRSAIDSYAAQCALPRKDCDRVQQQWFCSSESISKRTQLVSQGSLAAPVDSAVVRGTESLESTGYSTVEQSSLCVDTDNDGWGWDGQRSCRVALAAKKITDTGVVKQQTNTCIDPDGDGWGWNGVASCRVGKTVVRSIEPTSTVQSERETFDCKGSYTPREITDLVLVTGQSNVTGAETTVSARLDRWGKVLEFLPPDTSHPRVFAWTVDPHHGNAGTGWQIAALNQSWHDSAPGIGGIARNNFAFHFAKQVVQSDDCRVVGLVVVSEGGKGIAHWDEGATGWNEVSVQVNEAISALGRSEIDGILWHQGESDWIQDGTCFNTPRCRNERPDYYAQKLYSGIADPAIPNSVGRDALIDRLRRESWFDNSKPFIAGETIKAPVNVHLNKLNSDGDPWTACVDSDLESGLGIRADDPFRNHYNAAGLRDLGERYATAYLRMTK